jgi:hypothetical protein
VLILKRFAVYEEAAAGVEVNCVGVPLLDGSRSGWGGLQEVGGAEGLGQPMERVGLREWDRSRRWSMREIVRRGVGLEMERGKRKEQIPRCARNDNSRGFRRAELRVEAGSMAGRRRAVAEVGGIRTVGVGGRAGRGNRGCL